MVFGLSAHAVDEESSSTSSEYDFDFDFDFGDVSCPGNSVANDLTNLIQTSCDLLPNSDSKNKRSCKCLEDAQKENVLIGASYDQTVDVKKLLEDQKKQYQERFFDAYQKMTLQASIQSEILQISKSDVEDLDNQDEKYVGCSAKKVSEEITSKMSLNGSKHIGALKNLLKEKEKLLKSCKENDCAKVQKIIDQIKTNTQKLTKSMNPCELSMELLKKDLNAEKVKAMRAFFTTNKDEESLSRLKILSDAFENPELSTINNPSLQDPCAFINEFIEKTLTPFTNSDVGGGDVLVGQCDNKKAEDKTLCEVFNGINADLKAEVVKKYESQPKDCISNAEFETFKGMPGKLLMEELAKAKSPEDLLTIPKSSNSPLERERIKFLRSNPILAQLSRDPSFKGVLGSLLKNVAKNQLIPGKSNKDSYNDYLTFMKRDVAVLLKSSNVDKVKAYVCDELSNNFTAIQIANDLPDLNKPSSSDNYPEQLKKALSRCKILDVNEASTTNTQALLKTSPLFTLGLTDAEKLAEVASFDDMKNDICKDYNSDFAAASCDGKMDDNCRAKYLGTLPASAEIANATKGMIEKKMINPFLTVQDVNFASSQNDERKQNHEFISWWDQAIGSKLSKDVIASKGEEKQFIADQKLNLEIASGTNVPDRFLSPAERTTSNVVSPPGIDSPSVNSNQPNSQGQQIPEYSKDVEPFDVSKLASATSAKEMIPKFESLPPVKQKESLTEFKEFNATQPNSPISQQSIDEEIAKVNNKIEGNIKEISNKIEKISSAAPQIAPTGSAGISQSAPNPISQQSNVATVTQPVVNSHTNSSGGTSSAKIDTKSISSKATNKALLQANEFRESEANRQNEGRVPASLTADSGINFQRGLMDPSLLKSDLRVDVLTPPSHKEYLLIKENLIDLVTFLAKKIDVKDLKEPKIVKILDPKVSPISYLFFYVSKSPSGSIDVITVDRKYKLDTLKFGLPN